MKIYLVGGAVRDELLKRPVTERDWVVVGSTEKEMLALGYKKVGRDFPVFLHPETFEEYALARTERKTGKGYTKFICHADKNVTLEDDLKRRDLTINAMAKTLDGKIIDPYHGQKDLENKILRHVSSSFIEDPVRILRVARFAAKLGNFTVHPTTLALMKKMLENGEVDALVPERVWQEFNRALQEKHPEKFFTTLNDCNVLEHLFPEIAKTLPTAQKYLKKAVKISVDPIVRFAALTQNLTKEDLTHFCNRYRIPNSYKNLAAIAGTFKSNVQKITLSTSNEELLDLLEKLDVFRRTDRFWQFLQVVETGLTQELRDAKSCVSTKIPLQIQILKKAFLSAKKADIALLPKQNLSGEELKKIIHQARLQKITNK